MKNEKSNALALNYTRTMFQLAGKIVDTEVAKGRSLDDVLNERQKEAGGKLWFDKNLLKPFSSAVAVSFHP